jgi:hypothetical protein
MTPERRRRPADPASAQGAPERALVRILSIVGRPAAATEGPWGYLRPSWLICALDAGDVTHCLYDPDEVFMGDGLHALITDRLDRDWPCGWARSSKRSPTPWTPRPSGSRTARSERHWDVGWATGCQRGVGGPAQPPGEVVI